MPTIRLVDREEAQELRSQRSAGPRAARMAEFDQYVDALLDSDERAAVIRDMEEPTNKFRFTLAGRFRARGVKATIRKVRNEDALHVWID